MVELLCPVWHLTSALVAANCLDATIGQWGSTAQGERGSANEPRSSQTQSFQIVLEGREHAFFFLPFSFFFFCCSKQHSNLITPNKQSCGHIALQMQCLFSFILCESEESVHSLHDSEFTLHTQGLHEMGFCAFWANVSCGFD